jgi:hypothetical protein
MGKYTYSVITLAIAWIEAGVLALFVWRNWTPLVLPIHQVIPYLCKSMPDKRALKERSRTATVVEVKPVKH